MMSGLGDYANDWLYLQTLLNPDETYGPMDYFRSLGKSGKLRCDPGTCWFYSSNGYMLLGLILAADQGVDSWKDMDQLAYFTPEIRSLFNHTGFYPTGKCSDYPEIAHSYSQKSINQWPGFQVGYYDLDDYSCSNAWTAGDLSASAHDVALYLYELLGTENILTAETREKMYAWHATGLSYGDYGLGLMRQ